MRQVTNYKRLGITNYNNFQIIFRVGFKAFSTCAAKVDNAFDHVFLEEKINPNSDSK